MDELILTPSECVALINQTLEIAYPTILVEGEVGSFKFSRDKYVFFDLKDADTTLGCFMMAWQLRTPLEDGMKVKILAEPRLTRWGKFSLTVRQVMPVGKGSIKKAFEILKAALAAEGLLDEARKRSLPLRPRRIGVVTSMESAGYADFTKIINARWGGLQIEVADVQVQGLPAIEQNIAAISYFNQHADPVEVLVIIRGGGSADDLAIYNDERLVRAVAASRIPTLVGVGHEVDISLADLVADLRAATPSNAAQLLVPDRQEILGQLATQKRHLQRQAERSLELRQQALAHTTQRLAAAVDVVPQLQRVAHLRQALESQATHFVGRKGEVLDGYHRTLRQLNPELVLKRGYALVRQADGTFVETGQNLHNGDMIQIDFADARVQSEIRKVQSK